MRIAQTDKFLCPPGKSGGNRHDPVAIAAPAVDLVHGNPESLGIQQDRAAELQDYR
jgi:hypothetical protein